jgi:hypothetical protein
MQTRTILTTAAIAAVGALFGCLAVGRLTPDVQEAASQLGPVHV